MDTKPARQHDISILLVYNQQQKDNGIPEALCCVACVPLIEDLF